jgi:cysteine-rich secretory family protein
VQQVSPDHVVGLILDRVAAARARAGSPPLAADASLAAIAQSAAARAAGGELEGLAAEVSRAAAPHVGHQVAVSVHGVYDLDAFVPPDAALDAQMQSIGVGAVQSDTDLAGRIGVIVVLGK